MPIVTVVGAASAVLAVSLDGTTNLQLAQQFAAVVNGAAAGGTLFATNLGGSVPPVPRGDLGEAVVLSAGSIETLPAGYATATDVAAGPTTISASADTSPISVLAGTGGLTFNAGPGHVSFVVGGGSNVFNGYVAPTGPTAPGPGPSGSTDNLVSTGDGYDTISTGTANTDVLTGAGASVVTLGDGFNHVVSYGRDLIRGGQDHSFPGFSDASDVLLAGDGATVIGGSQPLTVRASAGGATPGGGGLLVTLGSGGGTIEGGHGSTLNLAGNAIANPGGNDTVNVGGATATVSGFDSSAFTSDGLLVNGPTAGGSLQFTGGNGTATVAGAKVAVTITGGQADDVTFTGHADGNMFAVFDGFQGNIARLDSSAGTGSNRFVSGIILRGTSAPAVQPANTILGGTGADLFVIRDAASSLTGGVGGTNTFDFRASLTGGLVDTISDFKDADRLAISGYTANGSAVLASTTVAGGSTTIILSDQTRIILQNYTGLTQGNFS